MTISVLVLYKENIGFLSQMWISDSVLIKWCFKWFIFPTEIQLYYIRYTISIQLVFGQTAAGKHSLSRRPLIYTMYCIYASPLETSLIARSVGPTWGLQDSGGPHVGPMNFAIWDTNDINHIWSLSMYTNLITVCNSAKSPKMYTILCHQNHTLQWRHNECDGVLNHRRLHCLLNCLFRRRLKKTSKLRVTGFCEGNSLVTGEFPAQKASNAENVSIWWRHHGIQCTVHEINAWKFCPARMINMY